MRIGPDAVCNGCSRRYYRARTKQRFCSHRCCVDYHNKIKREAERRKTIESFREALREYDRRQLLADTF